MAATGLALAAGKQAACELLAVVSQELVDFGRARLVQCLEKGLCAGNALIGLDGHKHPARRPVNGHKQVAPFRFVLHLREVFHVHVQVARLVALERFVGGLKLLRLKGVEVFYAVAPEAPAEPRARDSGNRNSRVTASKSSSAS